LGDVTAEMFELPPTAQEMLRALFGERRTGRYLLPGEIDRPEFGTVAEYKAAMRSVLAQVHALESAAAAMDTALHFESLPREDQNRRLILALAAQVAALTNRISHLEAKRPRAA
jgi:hypothetical protein